MTTNKKEKNSNPILMKQKNKNKTQVISLKKNSKKKKNQKNVKTHRISITKKQNFNEPFQRFAKNETLKK
jgi:cobyric acid synthase